MGRYRGPRGKIERRLGENLFLKGERSHSPKAAIAKRPYPPGVHTKPGRGKVSEFGLQLRSKQKVRNTYRLMEKQLKRTVKTALEEKGGQDGIVEAVESRLDNAVFRAGFAQSRDQARQIVNHGHILVNGKKVGIPSRTIKLGDVLSIREGSKKSPYFSALMPVWLKNHEAQKWIEVNKNAMTAKIVGKPDSRESGIKIEDIQAIVEFYSR